MPPIWVHASLALGGAALVGLGVRRGRLRQAHAWFGLGLVWGAVLPDVDLIVSSLASAAAGFDTHVGEFLHRTFTHSLLAVVALVVVAMAIPRRAPRLLVMGVAAGAGVLHLLPDLFYLVPTKLLAPASFAQYGPFGPINKAFFSDAVNNRFTAVDFLGESYWYVLVWHLARRTGTANRWSRTLPWLAAVNAVVYLFFLANAATWEYDTFILYTYAAGFPFLAVSTLAVPLGCRRTFLAVAGLSPAGPRSASPSRESGRASTL